MVIGTPVKVKEIENAERPIDRQIDLNLRWVVTDTDQDRAIIRSITAFHKVERYVVRVQNLDVIEDQ